MYENSELIAVFTRPRVRERNWVDQRPNVAKVYREKLTGLISVYQFIGDRRVQGAAFGKNDFEGIKETLETMGFQLRK